jgi:hypothetical protein
MGEDEFLLVRRSAVRVSCADDRERARAGGGGSIWGERGEGGATNEASGAILSELFGGVEGEPVQDELSGVRILLELF